MAEYDLTTFLAPRQAKEKRRPDLPCRYEGCTRKQWARGYCGSHYNKMKNAGKIENVRIKGDLRKRFFSDIEVNPVTLCWEWTGYLAEGGYGNMAQGKESKNIKTHRYSYELFYGPIRAGLMVCHHCDNRRCSNPAHLYAGSAAQNAWDCRARNRRLDPLEFAERRFSSEMALTMRILFARGEHSIRGLAAIYGAKTTTISDILKGRSYQT